MKANVSSLQSFYLRWAGLASAVLGFASFIIVLFAYRNNDPGSKLLLGLIGLVGAVASYAIGKDIMDRIRNQEAGMEMLSGAQARYAYLGTRFGFALSQMVLFLAMASIVYFVMPLTEKINYFCGPEIKSEGWLWHCLHTYFR